MQIFKDTNFDFLKWKWPFIIGSAVLLTVGFVSLAVKGGPLYGIDFKGGALVYVKFEGRPPVSEIRSALQSKLGGAISVYELTDSREAVIGTELKDEGALDRARGQIIETLKTSFVKEPGKVDFNNTGQAVLVAQLRDPFQRAGIALSEQQLENLVASMLDFRDTPPRSGLIGSFDRLSAVPDVTPRIISVLKQELTLAPFSVRRVEIVGPKVGADLRRQAVLATLYALGGMLVYIAFRFEWIYGVAAVLAVFHDVLITVGFFSLFNKEIDLTVVAALLTLVGFSMNDTIVVFDRIRENLKITRREPLYSIINSSINQTLSRTILTSGLTFLTVLSLLMFGGSVLNPFAFALVVGIIVGTYSSIFIASPILVFWQNFLEGRKRTAAVAVAAGRSTRKR